MEEKDIIPENPYYRTQDFGDGNRVEWNEQPEFSCFDEGARAQLKKALELLLARNLLTKEGIEYANSCLQKL